MKTKIEALKSDGHCYRYWFGERIADTEFGCVIDAPAGTKIHAPDGDGWLGEFNIRTFFPEQTPINLMEVADANGTPVEVYINVTSAMTLKSDVLQYVDYELDVVHDISTGSLPEIIDVDEFEEAKLKYSYSAQLIDRCVRSSEAALELIKQWEFGSEPKLALQRMSRYMNERL